MNYFKTRIEELKSEWLNKPITLSDLDRISGKDMSGKFDLKRDLMHSKNAGSFDDGSIIFEFRFIEGSEIAFSGKVVITDIYVL